MCRNGPRLPSNVAPSGAPALVAHDGLLYFRTQEGVLYSLAAGEGWRMRAQLGLAHSGGTWSPGPARVVTNQMIYC